MNFSLSAYVGMNYYSIFDNNKLYSTKPKWDRISLNSQWYWIIKHLAWGEVD